MNRNRQKFQSVLLEKRSFKFSQKRNLPILRSEANVISRQRIFLRFDIFLNSFAKAARFSFVSRRIASRIHEIQGAKKDTELERT